MIDPEIEIEASHESFNTGTYRGHGGMYELLQDFWVQFDDRHTEVKESIPSGADVVVALLHQGRAKRSGIDVEMWHWQVWTLRNGKAVRWRLFKTRRDALEAAGLGE